MLTKPNRMQRSIVKRGLDGDDCRKRRTDAAIQIRKSKKSDFLAKRRQSDNSSESTELATNPLLSQEQDHMSVLTASLAALGNCEANSRILALHAIRWALAEGQRQIRQLTEKLVQCNAIRSFVDILESDTTPQVQLEIMAIFSEIAASSFTHSLVEAQAVRPIIALAHSQDESIREHCLSSIANIAGESAQLREMLLECSIMPNILEHIRHSSSRKSLRYATWALSNLVTSPSLPGEVLSECMKVVVRVLQQHLDPKVLSEACWALAHITDRGGSTIVDLVNSGCVPVIARFLVHNSTSLAMPALHTMNNLLASCQDGRDMVIQLDVLRSYKNMLENLSQFCKNQKVWNVTTVDEYRVTIRMRTEVCKALAYLSNEGTQTQVDAIVKCDGLFGALASEINNGEWEIKKSALAAINNVLRKASNEQVNHMISKDVVSALCSVLDVADNSVLLAALQSVEVILSAAAQDGKTWVEEARGLDKLESLQEHQSPQIYDAAVFVLERHFAQEMEEEDMDVTPEVANGMFQFGVSSTLSQQSFPAFATPASPAW